MAEEGSPTHTINISLGSSIEVTPMTSDINLEDPEIQDMIFTPIVQAETTVQK